MIKNDKFNKYKKFGGQNAHPTAIHLSKYSKFPEF